MDAKNLEVLRKLKESMGAERASSRPPKNASGFSEESEAAFRELARKNLAARRADEKAKAAFAKNHPARTKSKSHRPANPVLEPQSKETKRVQQKGGKPAIWAAKACRFCKAEFTTNLNWSPQPIMCPACRKERKTRIGRSSKASGAMYSVIQVFSGGGPGSGKKR